MTLDSTWWPVADQPKTSIAAAPQSVAPAPQQRTTCPVQPAAAVAVGKDGRLPLQADVSGLIAADIASFIVLGKEAAAAGRSRDAEVAFLMSCRLADRLKGADSVESADAKYQLGSHYARLALDGSPAAGANRAELLSRAEQLYAGSLHTYAANYGQGNEKSRFAAEGLARVRQTSAQAPTVQPAPASAVPPPAPPAPAPEQPAQEALAGATEPARPAGQSTYEPSRASAPRPPPRNAEAAPAAAAAPKVAQAPGAGMRTGPSFNCAKARSAAEVIICSDPELSQLDRELGRVYARAKNSTSNPAAFRRQQEEEWRMRESICRNRDCLLRWYARRHEQLMNDIERRKQPQSTAYR
jgi:hypothetical protein